MNAIVGQIILTNKNEHTKVRENIQKIHYKRINLLIICTTVQHAMAKLVFLFIFNDKNAFEKIPQTGSLNT